MNENRRDTPKKIARAICLGVAVVILVSVFVDGAGTPAKAHLLGGLRCKYSVRDVGFVDVHAFGWQLTLAKPAQISDAELQRLDSQVRIALQRTNIHHLWISGDSTEFKEQRAKIQPQLAPSDSVAAILSNTKDEHFTFLESAEDVDFEKKLVQALHDLVDSPFRQKVLKSCCDSLCTIVLFESEIPEKNTLARKTLTTAIERLNKQMWMLEKPTEKPPQAVILPQAQLKNEGWFRQGIGLQSTGEPMFAIVYGQGRILGELISLQDASVDRLVGRASICGGDCECDLDKEWLYGRQFVHRWSIENERRAEKSLNFDPHAAYVKSEVATIVRKSRPGAGSKRIDLGPGLIIHDLDNLESRSGAQTNGPNSDKSKSEMARTENNFSVDAQDVDAQSEIPGPQQEQDVVTAEQSVQKKESKDDMTGRSIFRTPLIIMILLAFILGGVLFWGMIRST